jgi:S-adenosylmethionine:tRNA ribosyltransferase-isomerase
MWSLDAYDFELPEALIAYYPVAERDQSRLLVYTPPDKIEESHFNQLPHFLPSGTLLLFNVSKVIPARILVRTPTGAQIEIFCLHPTGQLTVEEGLKKTQSVQWDCLIRNRRRWRQNPLQHTFSEGEVQIHLLTKTENNTYLIQFDWTPPNLTFEQVLEKVGNIPLPPYIKRTSEEKDKERYQTVYASVSGSVAAPTAGLHFTPSLLQKLEAKGIQKAELILHVGYGTFAPIQTDDIRTHHLHYEAARVSKDTLEKIHQAIVANPIVPVGTTSLRTLESLYWLGLLAWEKKQLADSLSQELPYTLSPRLSSAEALEVLLIEMEKQRRETYFFDTQLYLRPGYRFQYAKGLITNFHLPKSSLLVLVASFIGESWRKVYQTAVERKFRFFSYGDASLLWREAP